MGHLTRDNVGTVKNVNITTKKPDFTRNPANDLLKKKRLKPPLAPIKEEGESSVTPTLTGKISQLGKTPKQRELTPQPPKKKNR